jgi:CO dehydrogenase maturation factor
MTKESYLEIKLNETIVESKGFDLVTMGRGEGPECYCYPNTVLRKFIDSLSGNYPYAVMDNEAGMEHLSRRTTQNVDELFIVSDNSAKGIRTAARIIELVAELKLSVKRHSVIVNFVTDKLTPPITDELLKAGIDPIATIPVDEEVYQYDLKLKPLINLPDTSKAVKVINDMMMKLLSNRL